MNEPKHFVVYTRDREGAHQIRSENRDAHLHFMKSLSTSAKIGGPIISDKSGASVGGMYVLEAKDLKTANVIAAGDPYVEAGLFEIVFVDEWKWQTRNLQS